MPPKINRQWVLKKRPTGPITEDCFERKEVEVPELKEGQVLGQNLLLSYDASQRTYTVADTYVPMVKLGEVMRAFGIAQVQESRNPKFKVGHLFIGGIGWQDYCVIQPEKEFVAFPLVPLADPTLMLALSITGLTGYFGMLKVGLPKEGDTVVVSGAAGATGSIAAQIAKLKGCRVIGIAGGAEKCRWLLDTLHLDGAIDYKNEDVSARLAALCPKGVNVYYDNVGGEISEIVYPRFAQNARMVACGAVSTYDSGSTDLARGPGLGQLILKNARAEGFLISKFMPEATSAMLNLTNYVRQGKLVQAIDVQEGFENIPKTLLRLFSGANIGKQLLRLSEPALPVPPEVLLRSTLRLVQSFRSLFGGI